MELKSKISLMSIVALLSFGTLNAQNNKDRSNNAVMESEYSEMDEDKEARKLERMSEDLNLDATQKEKIERLLVKRKREMNQFREERKEKMEELRNDESDADDYKKQKRKIMEDRKELHEEFKTDLRKILNDEQFSKFEEMEKQHKKEKFHHKKQRGEKMKPQKQEKQFQNKRN